MKRVISALKGKKVNNAKIVFPFIPVMPTWSAGRSTRLSRACRRSGPLCFFEAELAVIAERHGLPADLFGPDTVRPRTEMETRVQIDGWRIAMTGLSRIGTSGRQPLRRLFSFEWPLFGRGLTACAAGAAGAALPLLWPCVSARSPRRVWLLGHPRWNPRSWIGGRNDSNRRVPSSLLEAEQGPKLSNLRAPGLDNVAGKPLTELHFWEGLVRPRGIEPRFAP